MDWKTIDGLAARALEPLDDPWLEAHNENSEPYRRFLYWLALALRPVVAVELGVDVGHGTAHLCAAAAQFGGRVVGLDHRPVKLAELCGRWPGVLTVLWCDSLGGAQALAAERGRVGLVFQDSSHYGEHSRCEWNYWRPLLAPGAVWVADDVSASFKMDDEPFGMLDYWAWVPEREKRILKVGRPGNGLGVALT